MSILLQDLRFGLRALRKHPSYSLVVIAVIALGIGANTAIFSLVKGVLLHAFPYRDPDRLVILWEDATARGGFDRVLALPGNFLDWRRSDLPVEGLAAIRNDSLRFTDFEEPIVPLVHRVTTNYFDLLGASPLFGRTFSSEEGREGRGKVVLLSYGIWQSAFGGDRGLIGREVALDGEDYQVVGVMPPDFYSVNLFPTQPGIWVPMSLDSQEGNRRQRNFIVLGRLKDGTSLSSAQAAADTVARTLEKEYPDSNQGYGIRLERVREDVVGDLRTSFFLLSTAVGFLLLVACANVANLVLTRINERSRELTVRAALGAGRFRLLRQVLTESLLLALAGGAAGVLLALLGLGPMLRLIPNRAGVPFLQDVSVDTGVLMFTLLLTVTTGFLFGLAPAWKAGRKELSQSLREGGRSGSLQGFTLHRGLVVAQVALSLVLLGGAGLTVQSFDRLVGYRPGFDAERILTLRNSLRGEEFDRPEQRKAHFEELIRRLESLPGVESASAVSFAPPLARALGRRLSIEGQVFNPGQEPSVALRSVVAGYFETMGIPVLDGRSFDSSDRSDSMPSIIINQALARRHFQGRSPIGMIVSLDNEGTLRRQIVGVVGDVRSAGAIPAPTPAAYVPYPQAALPIMNLVIRSEGDPGALKKAAEREIWGMSGSGNVYAVETLADRIATQHWPTRLVSLLLSAFAGLALILGTAGIYAVISSFVSARFHEIGIRVALGAGRRQIHRMVLGEGLMLALIGVALGLVASWGLARFLSGQLYGVTSTHFMTWATVVSVLLAATLLACLIPSIRATRIDPVRAMQRG